MNEILTKIENFFKKIWWIVFIPIGLFILGIFKGKSSSEIEKEIKEAKKEIKKEEKEIKKEEEKVEKEEEKVKEEVQDIKETVEEKKEEKKEQDSKISDFLPGLKKK